MRKLNILASVLVMMMAAIIGAFAINGVLVSVIDGRTINDGFTITLIECLAYGCWFTVIGWVAARFLMPKPLGPMVVAAVGVFFCLLLSRSVWVNPVATSEEWIFSYVSAYAASFMVFPAFLLVNLFKQRDVPNQL